MGNNATVVILTDGIHDILTGSLEFAQHLNNAVNSVADGHAPANLAAGWNGTVAQLVNVHHADDTSIVLVGGNRGIELGLIPGKDYWPDERTAALEVIETLMHKYDIFISDLRTRQEKGKK